MGPVDIQTDEARRLLEDIKGLESGALYTLASRHPETARAIAARMRLRPGSRDAQAIEHVAARLERNAGGKS